MELLISGATIIDGVADAPIRGRSILIEGSRIKAIAARDELPQSEPREVIDASGKYAIPGLMNSNVHLFLARLESLIRYEGCYEDLILEAAQIALKGGLTTVFDTWGPRKSLMRVRDQINSGEVPGSRIYCAGGIVGQDGPFSLDFGGGKSIDVVATNFRNRINAMYVDNAGPDLTWMTPEDVGKEVREYLGLGVDFIKYLSSEHRWLQHEATASILFSREAQQAIVNEAHRAGTTAQAHTTAIEALRVSVEAGCDLIQHCNITGPVQIPPSTLELMAKRETGAVLFPFTSRRLEMIMDTNPPEARRFFSNVNDNCRNLMAAGAKLLLGTDGNILPADILADSKHFWMAPGEDNLAALGDGHFAWLRAMEEMGLPAMEGLRSATVNIARAYGKSADIGTLEPGKIADLLILDRDPLEKSDNYGSISSVIKEGVVVDRDVLPIAPVLTKSQPPPDESLARYGRFAISKFPCCM